MLKKVVIFFVTTSNLLGCSVAPNNVFNQLGNSLRGAVDDVEGQINKGLPSNSVLSELGGSLRENQVNK